jgi:acyl-CoA synthetase (NDP forming)
VSLTSGEPPPETKALLDAEGDGAPLLRGATEAFIAIAEVARWEQRHARRASEGPWRATWPALAADRTTYGGSPLAPPTSDDAAGAPALRALPERESLELLRDAGCAVTPSIHVPDAEAAVEAARPFAGHAVALKLDATGLAHKSDLGLVLLGLVGDDEVRSAGRRLLELGRHHGLAVRGLLVQPMADPGVELIVGMRRDASFGPVVLVGFGGVLAEVLDDVRMALAPLTRDAARALLGGLRGAALLDGVRGRPAVDRERVVDLIVAIAELASARPDIVEIDANPVIASSDGALAVDALVVLRDG